MTISSYGQWLKHRVNSGFQENASTGISKWSYTLTACVLSVLLVVLALVQHEGGAYINTEEREGVISSGSAWSFSKMYALASHAALKFVSCSSHPCIDRQA